MILHSSLILNRGNRGTQYSFPLLLRFPSRLAGRQRAVQPLLEPPDESLAPKWAARPFVAARKIRRLFLRRRVQKIGQIRHVSVNPLGMANQAVLAPAKVRRRAAPEILPRTPDLPRTHGIQRHIPRRDGDRSNQGLSSFTSPTRTVTGPSRPEGSRGAAFP